MQDSRSEVIEAARGGEPDRYLAALLAPERVRSDVLAVAAFAAEMRRIPSLVKEPMMGEIRLQWWRDSIDASASAHANRSGALAEALAVAAVRRALPRPMLQAMTEARAFDLYDDPMPDETAFHGYLAKTEATPFALALKCVGAADAPATLADHAGRAYGVARLLVDLPVWLSRGRLPLPVSYLTDAGTDANALNDDLREGRHTPGVTRLFDRLKAGMMEDAAAVRVMAQTLSRGQRVAVLPVATIPTYLRAFDRARREPLRTVIEVGPLSRITRIARAHWFGL